MRRNNFKSGDICKIKKNKLNNSSDFIVIIIEKLGKYKYRCLHKNKLKVFYYTNFEKIK